MQKPQNPKIIFLSLKTYSISNVILCSFKPRDRVGIGISRFTMLLSRIAHFVSKLKVIVEIVCLLDYNIKLTRYYYLGE